MSKDSSVPASATSMPECFQADTLKALLTVSHLEKSSAWYRDVLGYVRRNSIARLLGSDQGGACGPDDRR